MPPAPKPILGAILSRAMRRLESDGGDVFAYAGQEWTCTAVAVSSEEPFEAPGKRVIRSVTLEAHLAQFAERGQAVPPVRARIHYLGQQYSVRGVEDDGASVRLRCSSASD